MTESLPTASRSIRRFAVFPLGPALLGALGLLLAAPAAFAFDTPWFSDAPPSAQWAQRTRHAHGGVVERGRGGLYVKRLWYREGSGAAPYPRAFGSLSYDLLLLDAQGAPAMPTVFEAQEGIGISFAMPQEGFYNAYLVLRKVEGQALDVAVVQAEALKHSCGEGHDRRATEALMPPKTARQVPFEIVRERLEGENFHTRLASGDMVSFAVLYRGEPAAGAMVRLTTEEGWSKEVVADGEGRARFQLIRDYYPEWEVFDKRKHQSFLVTAALEVAEAGSHEGQAYRSARYSASLAGSYYPPTRDYNSYLYGLVITLLAVALGAGGVFLYRLRLARPSRERFDEAA